MKNKFILAAAIVCIFTAILHLVGGQISLVDPLFGSSLKMQEKVEWLGAWHMITGMLFYFGFLLGKIALRPHPANYRIAKNIGFLSLLFALAFILASLWSGYPAPQYILFLAISTAVFLGIRTIKNPAQ